MTIKELIKDYGDDILEVYKSVGKENTDVQDVLYDIQFDRLSVVDKDTKPIVWFTGSIEEDFKDVAKYVGGKFLTDTEKVNHLFGG